MVPRRRARGPGRPLRASGRSPRSRNVDPSPTSTRSPERSRAPTTAFVTRARKTPPHGPSGAAVQRTITGGPAACESTHGFAVVGDKCPKKRMFIGSDRGRSNPRTRLTGRVGCHLRRDAGLFDPHRSRPGPASGRSRARSRRLGFACASPRFGEKRRTPRRLSSTRAASSRPQTISSTRAASGLSDEKRRLRKTPLLVTSRFAMRSIAVTAITV